MFRKNEAHRQQKMFTAVDQLPKLALQKLQNSCAQVFYDEYFCRLDETVFFPLYSEKKSRPNTPVNLLVGFETLKSEGHSSLRRTPVQSIGERQSAHREYDGTQCCNGQHSQNRGIPVSAEAARSSCGCSCSWIRGLLLLC